MAQVELQELPFAVLEKLFGQLDDGSIRSLSKSCKRLQDLVAMFQSKRESAQPNLLVLPTELIHAILMHLDVEAIEFMAKTCKTLLSSVKSFESKHPSIMKEKWDDWVGHFYDDKSSGRDYRSYDEPWYDDGFRYGGEYLGPFSGSDDSWLCEVNDVYAASLARRRYDQGRWPYS